MSKINYHKRVFRSISNTDNGEVSEQTLFRYFQEGDILWAHYSGGDIIKGNIIGKVGKEGNLDFTYQHINKQNEFRTGKCTSTPILLDDKRIQLKEKWEWTSGDFSKGESLIEEIDEL